MVNHQDKLVLRKDEWFLGRPEFVPYSLKPPEATKLADGTKVYLKPFTFSPETVGPEYHNKIKKEAEAAGTNPPADSSYQVENI